MYARQTTPKESIAFDGGGQRMSLSRPTPLDLPVHKRCSEWEQTDRECDPGEKDTEVKPDARMGIEENSAECLDDYHILAWLTGIDEGSTYFCEEARRNPI